MRWLLKFRLLQEMARVIEWQALIIEAKSAEAEQMKLIVLTNQQAYRDLAVTFRVALEKPEIDLRDDLDLLIRDLSDQVSVLEEQIA